VFCPSAHQRTFSEDLNLGSGTSQASGPSNTGGKPMGGPAAAEAVAAAAVDDEKHVGETMS